jgi:hypothetical protein
MRALTWEPMPMSEVIEVVVSIPADTYHLRKIEQVPRLGGEICMDPEEEAFFFFGTVGDERVSVEVSFLSVSLGELTTLTDVGARLNQIRSVYQKEVEQSLRNVRQAMTLAVTKIEPIDSYSHIEILFKVNPTTGERVGELGIYIDELDFPSFDPLLPVEELADHFVSLIQRGIDKENE